MQSKISRVLTLACACVAPWLPGLAMAQLAAAKVPESPPIVLSYHETPIFLGPHEHSVTAIAFSPDGKSIATGSAGHLRIWDAANGRLRSIHAEDATRGVDAIAFSPDGRQVAVVGGIFGKEAVVWDIVSGRIAREFEDTPNSSGGTASSKAPPFIYKGKPIDFRSLRRGFFSRRAHAGDGPGRRRFARLAIRKRARHAQAVGQER